jgi:hypothetical protein
VAERTLAEPGVAIIEPGVAAQAASLPDDKAIDAFAYLLTREVEMSPAEVERSDGDSSEATGADAIVARHDVAAVEALQGSRVNVMARVRGWLRRAV